MMVERLLAIVRSVALFGARRPFAALAVGLVTTIALGSLIPFLKISTSRRDLVSEENENQRRTVEFDEKFGYPNAPVVVVTGGTVEERRRVVDEVSAELRTLPGLEQKVLGRIGPEDVAEVLLFQDPESIAKALPESAHAAKIRDGLPGFATALDAQMQAGLDGEVPTQEDLRQGFDRLGALFDALTAEVSGDSGMTKLLDADDSRDLGPAVDDAGYLNGSQNNHFIALFPPLEGDEGYQVRPVVRSIREARDRAMARADAPDVRADVTGLPALVTDELAMIERDLAVTSIASSVALFLTLFWAFRSFRQSLVSFLPLGFGTLVTFGIVQLVLGKLNLITASFTSVLLGLGDFGVHIQTRYSELLRKGATPKDAMEKAMLGAGPGLVVGTITTAVAFLTCIVTEFTAFAELGFITSVGLVVMLGGTYLLVPSAVLILLGKKPRPSPELPGFRLLAAFVRTHPRKILAASILSALVIACWLPGLRFNGRYFDFLPKDTESARGLDQLSKDDIVSPFVANVRVSSLEEARTVAAALREKDETVASVETPSDLLPELTPARLAAVKKVLSALEVDGAPIDLARVAEQPVNREALSKALGGLIDTLDEVQFAAKNGGRDTAPIDAAKSKLKGLADAVKSADGAKLDAVQRKLFLLLARATEAARRVVTRGSYLPADLPPAFQHRFVSKDQTELALFVHPRGDIWEVERAERFTADVKSVSDRTSGIATTLAEHPTMIIRGFERATLLAAVLVVLILTVSFRRASDVLVASLPLVLGTLIMLGAIPLMGLDFNHANMVVLPLLLGLGVDAAAHIMSRFRQSQEEHAGVASLDDMLAGTGSAVFVAALTTVWGFSVMMLAEYRAMFGMGLIMTVGMSATLILSLVTLPATLVLLKKAK
jgi:predicted RND superfamily exporter protein